MGTYIMRQIFDLNEKSHLIEFLNDSLTCLITIHTLEFATILIDGCIIVQNVDDGKIMTLTNLEIVRVMCRCNLNNTGSFFHICVLIANDGDGTVHDGKHNLLADQILVARIFRINCNCSITQHGLRTGSRELEELLGADTAILIYQGILNMPEVAVLFLVFNLGIRDRCLTYRTPVDDAGALVDPALVIHLKEDILNCIRAAFVHGETLSLPVCRRSNLLQLLDDASAVLCSPFPALLEEAFTAEFRLIDALFLQCLCNLNFGCDGSMVCTRLPEYVITFHSLITGENVLHGVIQCMSHMKLSCDIRRRHHDGEGFLLRIYFCMEVSLFFPIRVDAIFNLGRIIGLCKFFCHDKSFLLFGPWAHQRNRYFWHGSI